MTLLDSRDVQERVAWQGVLEALDEVVLLLNAQNVLTYASPSVAVRLGHDSAALAGRSLGDLVHPDDMRTLLRDLAELSATGVVRTPLRMCRADGGHAYLECSLTRTTGERGEELVVLCGRDGTARATLEERLTVTDQRYRALLGALGEAVVLLDAQLRVEEVNDRAAALLGRPAHELVGKTWFDALDVWDEDGRRVTMDSPFVRTLLTEPTVQEVWRGVLRPDGNRALLRKRWTPMPGGPSGLRGFVLTLQDAVGGVPGGASLPQQRRQARTAAGLTPREHEVLERLADGQDVMEIARLLELSVYSIRGHIKSLMRKLGVHSQLQAVVVAARRGIVDVVGDGSYPKP
ncbi:MAG TPA: PAS domain-containing protein [Kineosporiaceae bacterium]|nr:PAS domain-containing protein [Kineosporiaceae bacterium]